MIFNLLPERVQKDWVFRAIHGNAELFDQGLSAKPLNRFQLKIVKDAVNWEREVDRASIQDSLRRLKER